MFKNFEPHEKVIQAITDALKTGEFNGYGPSHGHASAREAVAKYLSKPGAEVTASVRIMCKLSNRYLLRWIYTFSVFCPFFLEQKLCSFSFAFL